jgi:lysophospholipase L1-like esterase
MKKYLSLFLAFLLCFSSIQSPAIGYLSVPNPVQLVNQPNTIAMFGDSITQNNFNGGLSFTGVWSSSITSVAAGGTGYALNDVLTLTGGGGLTVKVTSLGASNAVATASIVTVGAATSAPGNPLSSTGGTGSGATFNIAWTNVSSSYPTIGGVVWTPDYIEYLCPSGNGTIAFDGTNLTWTPQGLSAGTPVAATVNGKYYLPGPSASTGIWLNWLIQRGASSAQTVNLSVQTSASRIWNYYARGFGVSALAQSGNQMVFAQNTSVLNGRDAIFGMSGATSTDFLNAKAQWSQINADVYIELLGTNDFLNSFSPATTIANRTAIWNWVNAKGAILVIMSIPPNSTYSATTMKQVAQVEVAANKYAKTHARTFYANALNYLQDPNTGSYISGYSPDGTHPNGLGGYYGSKPLAQILSSLRTEPQYTASYGDIYDGTNNPNGNLLPTAGMAVWNGSGGGVNTGCSGTLATGWGCSRASGSNMNAALSLVSRTDGVQGNWQQVVLSGATTSEITAFQLSSGSSITSYGAGTTLEALLEVKVISSSGLNLLDLQMIPNSTGVQQAHAFESITGDPTPGQTLWLRIPQWTIPSPSTGFFPEIRLGTGNAGTATIWLGRVFYRKPN